jgi:hypothetical protein
MRRSLVFFGREEEAQKVQQEVPMPPLPAYIHITWQDAGSPKNMHRSETDVTQEGVPQEIK